jgi:hypothetical protein
MAIQFQTLHTVFTLANIGLILILLFYFYKSYRQIRSRFTLGLMIFAIVFLVNAIFRCPLFQLLFITGQNCPYTPYYTIASGFEFVALLILLYLVRE